MISLIICLHVGQVYTNASMDYKIVDIAPSKILVMRLHIPKFMTHKSMLALYGGLLHVRGGWRMHVFCSEIAQLVFKPVCGIGT